MINVAEGLEKGKFLFAVSKIVYFYNYYGNYYGVSLENIK